MYTSINDIDKKLIEKYPIFSKKRGFFIEAGANDGILQSNTYFFEKELFWNGILIEPVPEVYEKCKINRPFSIVENAALVADDYNIPEIVIEYTPQTHGLMSIIKGIKTTKIHLQKAGNEEGDGRIVKAFTLNQILEKHKFSLPQVIDFFSLDVEGYEPQALRGIDFNKWHIEYMLIEQQYNSKEIERIIEKHYKKIDQLSDHDYLWQKL